MINDISKNLVNDHSSFDAETSSADEKHIRDYVNVVLRRKWIIIAVFIVTTTVLTIHTFRMKPAYRAFSIIRIYINAPKVLSFEEVVSPTGRAGGKDFYETECQVIRSRSLTERVIKRLRLDLHPAFTGGSKAKEGVVNNPANTKRLIDSVVGKINVQHLQNSQLVYINAETGSPELCRDLANAFADEYIVQSMEDKVLTTTDATGEIAKQLEEIKEKIEISEKAMHEYAGQNDIIGDGENQNLLLEKLSIVSSALTEAEAERISKEIRFLQVQNSDDPSTLPGITDNKLIDNLKMEHARVMATIASERGRVKEDHPIMRKLEAEAEHIEKKIKDEQLLVIKTIKAEYQEAVGMEKALRQRLEEIKRANSQLEEKFISYKVLRREVYANTQLYEGMLQRMKEASVSSEIKTTNIQIIDRAEAPTIPFKPNKKRGLMVAMAVGLVIGISIAFFLDYLDNTVKTPDDVEKYLKLPVLGAIAKVESAASTLRSDRLVAYLNPKSVIAEAIRNIRTSLTFASGTGHKKRVILVTSSTPAEGKSFISSNLAVTLAQTGKKVLLVDADLRKPTLNEYMNIRREPGITNVLVGASGLEEVANHTMIPNLSFIPCGPIPPNPSELLGSGEMIKFLEMVQEIYDWVIVDSPPVASVTDAKILSNIVDGTILVIKSGGASKEHAKKTVTQLQNNKQNLIGVVLNNIDFAKDGYYYQSYYKYSYYKDGYTLENEKIV